MKILIINGYPKSGKDLFCEYACQNRDLVYAVSTVDRVKQVAVFAGWSGEKDEKGRKFLSDLKDAMTAYRDLPREWVINWIDYRLEQLEKDPLIDLNNVLFLIHSREPADIQRWKDLNGARALFIYREGMQQNWGNHADDEVANYDYDYYLNNGASKIYWENRTIEFIDQIRNEEWESHI